MGTFFKLVNDDGIAILYFCFRGSEYEIMRAEKNHCEVLITSQIRPKVEEMRARELTAQIIEKVKFPF